MDDLVARASTYATSAHARIQHLRKYSGQPYDVHLRAVAKLVATVSSDPAVIAAAWLHDVVEDTPATFEEIGRAFGEEVAALVRELTDVSRPADGNRAVRKERDRQHLAGVSPRAKTVKLADIIDNSEDICRHDPHFGRVYVKEARALLEVLGEGDPQLFRQAQAALEACAARLGKASEPASDSRSEAEPFALAPDSLRHGRQSLRFFTEALSARDILEPIASFDRETVERAPERVAGQETPLFGVREQGRIVGYVWREAAPPAGEALRVLPLDPAQRISIDAPLTDVVATLSRHVCCFVTLNGMVVGVVTRAEMEKPVVRMWLFGIIMLFEMFVVDLIRARWPEAGWTGLVSEGRLEKARLLQAERVRRGFSADLLDCLQFSDKFQLLLNAPDFLKQAGFSSAGAAKKALKELESLRNDLAHGQDIATHDWPPILRLAQRIQALGGGDGRGALGGIGRGASESRKSD